jgi:D-glycero-D-manno-heptose 1,7-bisphosphate phosphatase
MRSAVFLDRDGVINENRSDYVRCWEQLKFIDGVLPALKRLADREIMVIVVTNQSVIGRGLLSETDARAINLRLADEVILYGGRLTGIYVCPHHPDAHCSCRKPAPGMLLQAASDWEIDLSRSYLVGDALTDIEAARAVGSQGILVKTGRGMDQEALLSRQSWTCPVVADLAAAVDWILSTDVNAQNPG